jgi:hypothetical protein
MEQHLRRVATGRVLAPRRCGLNIHKKEILKLAGSAKSPPKIVEHLATEHQLTVHHNTISNGLKEWSHRFPGRNCPLRGKRGS